MTLLFLLGVLCLAIDRVVGVTLEQYDDDGQCGDGVVDAFTEECEGTDGCDPKTCFCKDGYTATEDGRCEPVCMFGEGCISNCIKPDQCALCDPARYTEDCSRCRDGYMWFGEGNCQPIGDRHIVSCRGMFELLRDEHLSFNYSIDFSGSVDDEPLEVYVNHTYWNYLMNSTCSEAVHPQTPHDYGIVFQFKTSEEMYVLISVDEMYTSDRMTYSRTQRRDVWHKNVLTLQTSCLTEEQYLAGVQGQCIAVTRGLNQFIHSPRLTFLSTGTTQNYLTIVANYAQEYVNNFNFDIKRIVHPCSTGYKNIDWSASTSGSAAITLSVMTVCLSNCGDHASAARRRGSASARITMSSGPTARARRTATARRTSTWARTATCRLRSRTPSA